MKCDSWVSLLAHTLASPSPGCEPKAKVATSRDTLFQNLGPLHRLERCGGVNR